MDALSIAVTAAHDAVITAIAHEIHIRHKHGRYTVTTLYVRSRKG